MLTFTTDIVYVFHTTFSSELSLYLNILRHCLNHLDFHIILCLVSQRLYDCSAKRI